VADVHPTGSAFRAAIERGDHSGAAALCAEDVVFHSPVVFKAYHGRAEVDVILAAVAQVFEDFSYTGEFASDDGCVLVFAARVGDRAIEGIDMLRMNASGEIADFTVMVRPYSAATALRERMAALLA
jgi:hypothetical protein